MTSFTKMHGLHNDFLVFDGPLELEPETIQKLCDRRSGVGADGVLAVSRSKDDVIVMQYWNADGSEAEMCGNGLRCVASYAVNTKKAAPGAFPIQTPVGLLEAIVSDKPDEDIEVQVGKVTVDETSIEIHGLTFYEANVGNPHAITFVDVVEDAPVALLGPQIENDSYFPHKTNVEFVEIASNDRIKVRVWERGSGETMACGTGMVSCVSLANKIKNVELPTTVEVDGGIAQVWIDDDGYSRMKAPVEAVYTGSIEL